MLLRPIVRPKPLVERLRPLAARFFASVSTKPEPLRLLFCGSDDFSSAALKVLHAEHVKKPELIASIDVVCRSAKRTGRGLHRIREGRVLPALIMYSSLIGQFSSAQGCCPGSASANT